MSHPRRSATTWRSWRKPDSIYQPHTSAGRVPTDRGYRVFVDRLAQLKPMSAPERQALETFLSESVDIDDVVERSVRLLAQVTHQVAS